VTASDGGKIRLDKWLWHARFFKTRGLASEVAASGTVRLNGERVAKASQAVRPGDVLTFPKTSHVRIIQIDALGERRGPAAEAQALYTDLSPPPPKAEKSEPPSEEREAGSGRPTKRDRRKIDALRRTDS
jgi:ribosome-associated heat shock protein Hsp15